MSDPMTFLSGFLASSALWTVFWLYNVHVRHPREIHRAKANVRRRASSFFNLDN